MGSIFTLPHILYVSLACILTAAALSGCSAVQLVVSFDPAIQKIRAGEQAFERGDYQKADAIFSDIYADDTGAQTRNTALYNLACTRIITAQSTADFTDAVELLQDWQKSYQGVVYVENPNMVIAALQKRAAVLTRERQHILEQERLYKTTISQQQNQLKKLKAELETVRHKLTELQAIDQQLQEKKKPL